MIDFKNIDVINNPYPHLAELRRAEKPIWHPDLEVFLAATHRDANEVLRNKSLGRIYTERIPETEWQVFNWLHSDSILDSEPPKHTRLRGLVLKAFNRNRIEGLRPAIQKITDELLDEIELTSGTFDLIADFAEPLPVKVIALLLGFPVEDEHLLRPWSQSIVKMYEVNPPREHQIAAQKAAQEFADYVHSLMLERKKNPTDDLITELATVHEAGERLSTHELIATCVLLLNAGHEASVNGFGNGMVSLFEHPTQRDLLFEKPEELTETAIEEFLRFDSPLQYFERTATSDLELGGVSIKSGQKIVSLLGSANRDSSVFGNADVFDVARKSNPHIGFGAGIHFCIGAPLARLEMSVSLPALIKRFPNLKLSETPVRRPTFSLRGYERVTVSA
ncbi:MAG: cytochrome P450 [Actinobacteria bacterium]|jgi:cytochrome P450|nr:cytochrome P450 [Actinomycetota bacterium]NCU89298.1 cytochrome P450 [Actinomycetota bacterium]NDE53372.1 cytochrome P450 [Actinomycetota bacterium]